MPLLILLLFLDSHVFYHSLMLHDDFGLQFLNVGELHLCFIVLLIVDWHQLVLLELEFIPNVLDHLTMSEVHRSHVRVYVPALRSLKPQR